jgi:thiol:disulfide interchange protein DsbD
MTKTPSLRAPLLSLAGLILCTGFFAPPGARAAESEAVTTAHSSAQLVTESDSFAPGKQFRIGLHLTLAKGWHTYWQNPGDAGAAPTLTLQGATLGDIAYPAPTVDHEGTLTTYTYRDEIVLSAPALPAADAHGNLPLTLDATWLVCANICVPESGHFTIDLPEGSGNPGATAALFKKFDPRLPQTPHFTPHIDPSGQLWLEGSNAALIRDAHFYPDQPGIVDNDKIQPVIGIGNQLVIKLPYAKGVTAPDRLTGVLLVEGFYGALTPYKIAADQKTMPSLPHAVPNTPALLKDNASAPATGAGAILGAALLAFLGGLTLNLMPCVLPVIALKALALARLSGTGMAAMRREAGLYAAGVITAFAIVGGFAIALHYVTSGMGGGWGTQFQSPLFTGIIAILLGLIGLNLSGVFDIGAGIAGRGSNLATRGSFFTGLLAVVVATPCTAPFMGTALAVAFANPAIIGLTIFICLGIGLAAPMLLLALAPGAMRHVLPKPGAWMAVFKSLLAFPMYGAALWLIWVASALTGQVGFAVLMAAILTASLGAFAFGRAQMASTRRGETAWLLVALLAASLTGAAIAQLPRAAQGHDTASTIAGQSEPYSAQRLADLRAAGTPVFVDASAAWCVTCLVNEQTSLNTAQVGTGFAAKHIVLLKADWTRPDPAITALLHSQHRDGVPLYLYYPPHEAVMILPQILTPSIVLRAIGAGPV